MTYSLRASHNLEGIRVHSTLRSTNICVYGVRLWNYLSNDTKNINNINAFKSKYKKRLFYKYVTKKFDCYRTDICYFNMG